MTVLTVPPGTRRRSWRWKRSKYEVAAAPCSWASPDDFLLSHRFVHLGLFGTGVPQRSSNHFGNPFIQMATWKVGHNFRQTHIRDMVVFDNETFLQTFHVIGHVFTKSNTLCFHVNVKRLLEIRLVPHSPR